MSQKIKKVVTDLRSGNMMALMNDTKAFADVLEEIDQRLTKLEQAPVLSPHLGTPNLGGSARGK